MFKASSADDSTRCLRLDTRRIVYVNVDGNAVGRSTSSPLSGLLRKQFVFGDTRTARSQRSCGPISAWQPPEPYALLPRQLDGSRLEQIDQHALNTTSPHADALIY